MSVHICCDMCGRPLDEPVAHGTATIKSDGQYADDWYLDPWERHLCAGGRDDPESCLSKALALFDRAMAAHRESLLDRQLAAAGGGER